LATEGVNKTALTLRPPIKGRIPPINGSTPVALYVWNLFERQKPGIPLIKSIATLGLRPLFLEEEYFIRLELFAESHMLANPLP
jgi:hypothetical protein